MVKILKEKQTTGMKSYKVTTKEMTVALCIHGF